MSGPFVSFLAEHLDVLRALVDQTREGVVVLSEDAHVVDANRRAITMAGTTRDTLVGTDVRELFCDAEPIRALIAAAGNGPPHASGLRGRLRTGGEAVPVNLALRRFGSGLSVLTWRESTESGSAAVGALRARVEELEQVSRWFQSVVEVSPVPHALNGDTGNITYLNPAFVRTFGYELGDLPTLDDWWPKAYPDERYRAWVMETWRERLETARATSTDFEPTMRFAPS
jgi:PAS domain S-box-containing protein